ncbi:PD-(D/E)XK nuclease family protein [Terriglobus albidus]|uniref:PD-(D/E)XK nuclease family protein n=1 Tax=Terriglobus albidus TaxID=1592106 RepID=UPI00164D116E|nr:PD-(D/E)XK nuclease family protein [Terriglobus albidus]
MPFTVILEALQRGATILTGNQRAARSLSREYARHQRAQGLRVWQSPVILPWSAWTHTLWQQLLVDGHEHRLLLNPWQESELWRRIIADDERLSTLQSADSLAPLAQRAHTLMHRHRARRNLEVHNLNADQQAFLRWLHAFERTCRADACLSSAELESALLAKAGELRLAREYLLHGFDGLTPAQRVLLHTLRAQTTFSETPPIAITAHASLHAANSPDDELRYLAQQVRDRHAAEPSARIAVIVPDLQSQRSIVERAFRNTVAPWLNRVGNTAPAPFEFTLGTPLSQQPAIVAALRLIRWINRPLALDEVSSLLRSPFLKGAEEELLARADFDARVLHEQALVEPTLSADRLLSLIRTRHAPRLDRLEEVLHAIRRTSTRARSFSQWSTSLRALLEACGWPGDRSLDSAGFQLMERWQDLLDDLTSLDFTGGTYSFSHMLGALEQAAHSTLFSLRSLDAPIQIMGALESSGSTFDAIFFLNATNTAWPAPVSAHPLLPFALQRINAMPGADAATDIAQAQRITGRILSSAPTVVVTYAREFAEGEQLPSPLFTHLPQIDAMPQPISSPDVKLEPVDDTEAIPVPHGTLRGGSSLLRNQAACAFRAFAEGRLHTRAINDDSPGLTPRSRGNVTHAVLEHFWKDTVSQAALKSMPAAELAARVDQAIDDAFAQIAADASSWNRAYLSVQRERLRKLVLQWLEYEKKRCDFTVAGVEEKRENVAFGPLELTLRADRIDRTEEGLVLIDYKTGQAKPKSWLGDRPDEPQLPLYASLPTEEPVAAIAFATLRAGKELQLAGFQSAVRVLPRPDKHQPKEPFEKTLARWKDVLLRLAEEFYAGHAEVNPKNYPATCEFCEQRLLCRLNPANLDRDDEDAAEDEDE